jgi:hypothetical protein
MATSEIAVVTVYTSSPSTIHLANQTVAGVCVTNSPAERRDRVLDGIHLGRHGFQVRLDLLITVSYFVSIEVAQIEALF